MAKGRKTTVFDLLGFIVIFGIWGPYGIYIGIKQGNYGLIIIGGVITLFFWGIFGFGLLKELRQGE